MVNHEVRHIFKTRSKVVSFIRKFLDDREFLEVSNFCSFFPVDTSISDLLCFLGGDSDDEHDCWWSSCKAFYYTSQ
jgi:hypothetical protein